MDKDSSIRNSFNIALDSEKEKSEKSELKSENNSEEDERNEESEQ